MTWHAHDRKRILRMRMGPRTIPSSEVHNWSAGFPSAHAFWCRPFGVHLKSNLTVANMPVSLGVRSLVLYFSI